MDKIAISNPGSGPMYVGAAMIAPGETRLFERHHVPAHLLPENQQAVPPAPPPPPDRLADLVAGNAKTVIAAIPALSNEDLTRCEQLEQARGADGNEFTEPRKTVLEAISEETLKRAGSAPV